MADGDADGVALFLEDPAVVEQLRPGLGRVQPGLLEVSHVVRGRKRDPEPWNRPPARLRLAHLRRERIPAPALLAELVHDVTHVDQEVLIDEGDGAMRANHVVTRLGLRFGSELGIELKMGDGVDADGRPSQLAERLGLLPQLVVGGRDEVVPGEECQLVLLGEGRRPAERQPGRHAGGGTRCDAEELTTRGCSHRGTPWYSARCAEVLRDPAARPTPFSDRTVARFYHPGEALSIGGRLLFSARAPRWPRRAAGSRPLRYYRLMTRVPAIILAFAAVFAVARDANGAEPEQPSSSSGTQSQSARSPTERNTRPPAPPRPATQTPPPPTPSDTPMATICSPLPKAGARSARS